MRLLPWRRKPRVQPRKEAEVVYVCREVQQVGYKLEGSLNRLDTLITMINDRDKVAANNPSLPTSVTEA
jgi:hypothetical protein